MKEIFDSFLWTKERKIITYEKHHVPGLAVFGHWDFSSATAPAEFHYHTNIFEIHTMLQGRRIFLVEEDDKQIPYIVRGNQLSVTFPGQPHGYNESFVEPYEFYSFQIDISDPDHLLGLDEEYSRELCNELFALKDRLQKRKEHILALGSVHLQLLRSAFNLFSAFDTASIRTGVQFLCCFLFSLKYLEPPTANGKIGENINRCILFMNENMLDNPPLEAIANVSGYSLSYFKSRFKKEMGITPADYLLLLRIEYAKYKLSQTNCSITRLSMELNFSSPSYFCSTFKRLTAYTPKEYREKYGNA